MIRVHSSFAMLKTRAVGDGILPGSHYAQVTHGELIQSSSGMAKIQKQQEPQNSIKLAKQVLRIQLAGLGDSAL